MPNHKPHILIVDDDLQIQELLQEYLTKHGLRISTASNGQQMRKVLQTANIDLIVLDIMLPGEDGFTLCQQLRENSDVLIIMLSAVAEETDRVVGLEIGADDYLTKPFSPRELLARIKALLRRQNHQLTSLTDIRFLNWRLDRNQRQLMTADNMIVPLSNAEYTLLLAFLNHPQRILSRDQLLDLTQGRSAEPFDRTIDVQVGRLRKKIEIDPKKPHIIVTVRGGGYQFTPEIHFK